MPLSPPARRTHLHARKIAIDGYVRNDGKWEIEGRIVDNRAYAFDNEWRGRVEPETPLHEMWARLTLEDDLTIVAIEVATDQSPFAICPEVLPNFQRLVGAKIGGGFLRDIGSGEAYAMFLETSPVGTSCHLDANGVKDACDAVLGQVGRSDVVVLSKFGKLEAGGGGLAPAFAAVIAAGKPVLTTVSDLHRAACHQLAPDALHLPADAKAIRDWWATIAALAT